MTLSSNCGVEDNWVPFGWVDRCEGCCVDDSCLTMISLWIWFQFCQWVPVKMVSCSKFMFMRFWPLEDPKNYHRHSQSWGCLLKIKETGSITWVFILATFQQLECLLAITGYLSSYFVGGSRPPSSWDKCTRSAYLCWEERGSRGRSIFRQDCSCWSLTLVWLVSATLSKSILTGDSGACVFLEHLGWDCFLLESSKWL